MEGRELGVDLARGVAVVSMFVAHTAPSSGPLDLLYLSEFLTFPLFAMLVGIGAELGSRRSGVLQHGGASVVRAVVLVALGWALAEAGAYVVVVLAPLGVLTVLCWGLCRLPTTALLPLGAATWLVAPWTVTAGEEHRVTAMVEGAEWRLRLLDLLVSPYYPQAVLVVSAVTGIVLVRMLLPPEHAPGARVPALLAGVLLAGCAAAMVLRRLGLLEVTAYETTWAEQVFVVALSAAVVAGSVALGRVPAGRALQPLAWVGGMTLTLYVLQILWLAWWVRVLRPGQPDDTWLNVALLVGGSLVLAVVWRSLRLPGPVRRGPLEGLVGLLVAAVSRLLLAARIPSRERAEVP